MTRILFVGTAENRFNGTKNDPYLTDLPELIDIDGNIIDETKVLSEIEKYKSLIFETLKLDIDTTYNTVDPEYSYNKKKEKDNINYLGHFQCLLEDLDVSLDFKFDYIIITNCYNDFFTQRNIDKLNKLSKYHKCIYILRGVKYVISDYMREKINYKFINI